LSLDLETLHTMLEQAGRPITRRELSESIGLDHAESDQIVKPLLLELIRQGKVVRNRRAAYGLAEHMNLIPGRISAHPDGFGFVVPDAGGDDLFLAPRQMRQVFHGDRVLAAVIGLDRRGRKEGQIVEVIERSRELVVGRYLAEGGVASVVPDDPKLTHDIVLPKVDHPDARPGKIVVVRITRPPTLDLAPLGEIVAVLGHADEPGMATEIAIFSHGLPAEFPQEVEQQAQRYGGAVDPNIAARRTDLRQTPLVTIDGADARDFDDAVFAEAHGDGFRLLVAIADVAEYVTPDSPLDQEAVRRGTSTYFPDRVVPMLPETLSNGLCSLNPEVDRLVLVCEMKLNASGKITSSRFFEGVMRSAARLTYDQVREMIELGDEDLNRRFAPVRATLDTPQSTRRDRFRLQRSPVRVRPRRPGRAAAPRQPPRCPSTGRGVHDRGQCRGSENR